MPDPGLIMYEEEFKQIEAELRRLHQQANAKVTFLVDKNGQLISAIGETENLDTTSLASLTAGNIAATGGMAKLLGEKDFSILFHEGERDNIHISLIGRVILVVIFDQRSSLGLVRLRVKKSVEILGQILQKILQKVDQAKAPTGAAGGTSKEASRSPFAEITEDDIEKLFD
ncbi:MAG: roadblock/LC7 domain-containing protein [Nitrospirae bacterium]|nr:roadblock/LC7 domain-containing protein [Nitrospirota bacterium]